MSCIDFESSSQSSFSSSSYQIALEFTRSDPAQTWAGIPRQSLDWAEFQTRYPDALVVRAKCLLAGEARRHLQTFEKALQDATVDLGRGAINAVAKAGEFSVSASSPIRCCFTMLFVYGTAGEFDPVAFRRAAPFLPADAYITLEQLDCFLMRRALVRGEADATDALRLLTDTLLTQQRPASSLFLKLTATNPDDCLRLLQNLSQRCSTPAALSELVGSRSVHRLVSSLPSCTLQMALDVMQLIASSQKWEYVAYNTILRLAADEGRLDQVYGTMLSSNLNDLDKIALDLVFGPELAGRPRLNDARAARLVRLMTPGPETPSPDDLRFVLDLLRAGTSPACHLASIVLRRCAEIGRFAFGWAVASATTAVSKQVFSEAVHMCSLAYFAESRRAARQSWYDRVRFCIERHLMFLNRYPCGLALHLASHARQFDVCWRWFTAMVDQLAFRLTGYHTSAVLKAASYAPDIETHLDKIRKVYAMTPNAEKSTFTFVPLTRIWNLSSASSRTLHMTFWDEVAADIKMLQLEDRQRDATSVKMANKLRQWVSVQERWKMSSVAAVTAAIAATIIDDEATTTNDESVTKLLPAPRMWTSPAPSVHDDNDEVIQSKSQRAPVGKPRPAVTIPLGNMWSASPSIWGPEQRVSMRSWTSVSPKA